MPPSISWRWLMLSFYASPLFASNISMSRKAALHRNVLALAPALFLPFCVYLSLAHPPIPVFCIQMKHSNTSWQERMKLSKAITSNQLIFIRMAHRSFQHCERYEPGKTNTAAAAIISWKWNYLSSSHTVIRIFRNEINTHIFRRTIQFVRYVLRQLLKYMTCLNCIEQNYFNYK